MIGRLRGQIVEREPGRLLLDVGGVGYELMIPLSTFYAIAGEDRGSGEASLLVHTHVREDVLQLYGFRTADERAAFELLIGISGVGPRLALAVLSGIGVPELRAAVVAGDRARLQKIPGVGKKTAERILLELRDRWKIEPPEVPAGAAPQEGAPGPREDAISALINLGYGPALATRAVDGALATDGPEVPIERLLRASLARIVG